MRGPKTTMSLQSVTETSDDYGTVTEAWTTMRTLRGVLTSSRGREMVEHGKRTVRGTHVFLTDCPNDVTPTEKHRLVYGSRIFNIVFIDNPGNANRHLAFTLEELT